MKTNETIFAEIKAAGFMTEKQMQLLKNRGNKGQRDLFPYAEFNEYLPLSAEWANKGLQWLKSLLKSNGEPRKGQPLGYREIEIIKTATPEDFTFIGFYDAGSGWHRNYIPVYNVAGMEYRAEAGKIIVTGQKLHELAEQQIYLVDVRGGKMWYNGIKCQYSWHIDDFIDGYSKLNDLAICFGL